MAEQHIKLSKKVNLINLKVDSLADDFKDMQNEMGPKTTIRHDYILSLPADTVEDFQQLEKLVSESSDAKRELVRTCFYSLSFLLIQDDNTTIYLYIYT